MRAGIAVAIPGAPKPWSPRDLSGLALWLDAADSSTLTLNSTTVSQQTDKSGRGNTASQGTALSQPTYSATGAGGRPELTYDGGDFLAVAGAQAAVHMAAFVFRPAATVTPATAVQTLLGLRNDYGTMALGSVTGSLTDEIVTIGQSAGTMRVGWTDAAGQITAAPHILIFRWTGSTYEIRIDGATKPTASAGTVALVSGAAGEQRLGSGNGGGFYSGGISEAVLYDTAKTAADAQQLERYASAKWGITL